MLLNYLRFLCLIFQVRPDLSTKDQSHRKNIGSDNGLESLRIHLLSLKR